MEYNGKQLPVMVEGKRLALPTQERLKSGDWSSTVAFHPLSENLLRGESPVLKKYKAVMVVRLHMLIAELCQQLLQIGADTASHAKMSPKAQELLSRIPNVDEKSKRDMEKILEATSPDGPNRLVSIYLKRGGVLKGAKHSRLAVISFPIMEEFENAETRTVYGVKLRKDDFKAFKNLFDYILPDADSLETYSVGSQSMVAPYFDALTQAWIKVGQRLNAVVKQHAKQLEDPDILKSDFDEWPEAFSELSKFKGHIPVLAGNDGSPATDEKTEVVETIREKPLPRALRETPRVDSVPWKEPEATPPSLPNESKPSPFNTDLSRVLTPDPVPAFGSTFSPHGGEVRKTASGLDFNSLMSARNRTAAPQQAFAPQPQPAYQNQWGQPGGFNNQPVQPAVGSGGYAGFHRGMRTAPVSSFGYPQQMQAPAPDWVHSPNQQVVAGSHYGAAAWPNRSTI